MTAMAEKRCTWCNTDPVESAKMHEGPHATWCPRYERASRPAFPAGETLLQSGQPLTRGMFERAAEVMRELRPKGNY